MSIPWSEPAIDEEERDAARKVIDGDWWTQGEETERLEQNLANYLDSPVAAVNSGTSALLAALMAHDIGRGDEVLLPAYTFPAAFNTVAILGVEAIPVDADRQTFNMDLDDLQEKISSGTDAVITADVAGMPNDLDAIRELCNDHNVTLIEDAAQALGAKYKNTKIGGHDHTAVFSLNISKQATTVEGGAVAGKEEIVDRVKTIRKNGMGEKERTSYQAVRTGFKMRLTDIQAAIGNVQLKKMGSFLQHRAKIADTYRKHLPSELGFQQQPSYVSTHPYTMFLALFNDQDTRDRVREHLADSGIETRVYTTPLHRQPSFIEETGKNLDLPVADELFERSLSLPTGNDMSLEKIETVAQEINEII